MDQSRSNRVVHGPGYNLTFGLRLWVALGDGSVATSSQVGDTRLAGRVYLAIRTPRSLRTRRWTIATHAAAAPPPAARSLGCTLLHAEPRALVTHPSISRHRAPLLCRLLALGSLGRGSRSTCLMALCGCRPGCHWVSCPSSSFQGLHSPTPLRSPHLNCSCKQFQPNILTC